MKYAALPTAEQLDLISSELSPGGTVSHERRIRGGLGCTMDILHIHPRVGKPVTVVLRRHGSWDPDNGVASAWTEFRILETLERSGIPAPWPMWFDERNIFENGAMVISFLPGEPLLRPEDPVDYTSQLAQMLARIHDVSLPASLAASLVDYNAAQVRFATGDLPPERVRQHRLGTRLWERQKEELQRIRVADPVFLHGDYWPGNTLWAGRQLSAVVDFEETGIGDPAHDVATAVVNFRYEPWREAAGNFLEVYRAETGRRLESLEFWSMKELMRPMPDIKVWLPSFREMSSMPNITADELRSLHDGLILEALQGG